MTTGTCEQCTAAPATTHTPTGRGLCAGCNDEFTTLAGAAATMAGGGSPASAVGVGLASGGYASSLDVEGEHRARQRAKLAATEGFWARLKVRIIG